MRERILHTGAPILALIVSAAMTVALAAQTNTGVDTAYAAGYNAAYALGVKDKAAGAGANARKFTAYEDGSAGYTAAYGSRQTYRTRFQNGFSDGYFDGYNGRERALLAPPPAPPRGAGALRSAPREAGQPPEATNAKASGYREGYNIGQSDANSNAVYNSTASNEYKQGLVGYTASLGSSTDYQTAFRRGFTQGYDDGFNHHLYNSAIGARTTAAPAAAAGANDLPLSATDAATRPSGVYDNGILVAQGTVIRTQLDKELDTKDAYAGEAFTLTTTVPVWVGAVAAIPAGSKISGIVQSVQRGGKLSGHAQLQLQYNNLIVPGQAPIPLNATTNGVGNSAQTVNGQEGTVNGQGADTAKKAGTGAAIGAVLGGIFGGYGGLARGAIAGAAVGTAGVLISHKKDITLRAGETIAVRLDHPLELPKPAN
ncbi:MAG: hypothetical protein EPN33_08230 [Acidobacteria bacterium]|nr:MAG: hypothetical protein EPN33_08230 [Acidobacteriota bacterium]